jgi:hypothetical protein
MFSHDLCFGVKTNSNLPGTVARYSFVSSDVCTFKLLGGVLDTIFIVDFQPVKDFDLIYRLKINRIYTGKKVRRQGSNRVK